MWWEMMTTPPPNSLMAPARAPRESLQVTDKKTVSEAI